jgi:hypothetical protein
MEELNEAYQDCTSAKLSETQTPNEVFSDIDFTMGLWHTKTIHVVDVD